MGPMVFISHAWEDKSVARQLETELSAAGAEVWVDHSGIHAGDSISVHVSDALKKCSTFLLLWSKAANTSQWIQNEWSAANGNNKKIIPCILDDTKLPALLTDRAYVDLRSFEQGMAALRQALNLPERQANSSESQENDGDDMDQGVAVKVGTMEIELKIDRDFEKYTEEEKAHLLRAIRELLGMRGDIKITKIRPGSVLMSLELPPDQAEKLYWAVKAGALDKHGVVDATLVNDKDEKGLREDQSRLVFKTTYSRPVYEIGALEEEAREKLLSSLNAVHSSVKEQEMHLFSDDVTVAGIIRQKGYFDRFKNPYGKGIQHQYEVVEQNGGKVVIDGTTGLMWQQFGSQESLTYVEAERYVFELNEKKFAGYNDWRLPTVEELMSLMEPTRYGDLHICPVFERTQQIIWTARKKDPRRMWVVNFSDGVCNLLRVDFFDSYVRAVRSG